MSSCTHVNAPLSVIPNKACRPNMKLSRAQCPNPLARQGPLLWAWLEQPDQEVCGAVGQLVTYEMQRRGAIVLSMRFSFPKKKQTFSNQLFSTLNLLFFGGEGGCFQAQLKL